MPRIAAKTPPRLARFVQLQGSLTDGFTARAEQLASLRHGLKLPADAAGVLVARETDVIGADLFDAPATFQAQWRRLGDAYLLGAIQAEAESAKTESVVAHDFLRRSASCATLRCPSLGLGEEMEIRGDGLVGAVLVYAGRICQLATFSEAGLSEQNVGSMPDFRAREEPERGIFQSAMGGLWNRPRGGDTMGRTPLAWEAMHLWRLGGSREEPVEASMSEQPPLVRQWTLLRALCARHYGATVKELAIYIDGAAFHVGQRLRRDRFIRDRLRNGNPPWRVEELRATDLGQGKTLAERLQR